MPIFMPVDPDLNLGSDQRQNFLPIGIGVPPYSKPPEIGLSGG